MSILNKLSAKFRVDVKAKASTIDEIRALQAFSDINIPNEYLEIIKEGSEFEINVDNEKYIRIWGATGCVEMNEAYSIQEYIPKSLAIADDEGGNALIYVIVDNSLKLCKVAFNDLDVDELQEISSSLEDLLVNEVGIEVVKVY
ncbi:MAG: SMI1/KNR4 family protein [Clostridia bacterium]|nr:SMI1/KNR4 family protein [Clostridia bacterium]